MRWGVAARGATSSSLESDDTRFLFASSAESPPWCHLDKGDLRNGLRLFIPQSCPERLLRSQAWRTQQGMRPVVPELLFLAEDTWLPSRPGAVWGAV